MNDKFLMSDYSPSKHSREVSPSIFLKNPQEGVSMASDYNPAFK